MVPGVEEELAATSFINQRTDQSPEDGEDSGSSDDEDTTQGLRIVCLADLNNMEQSLDPRSPQVTHVQSIYNIFVFINSLHNIILVLPRSSNMVQVEMGCFNL